MWKLKSALATQASTVNKLLKEGYEPFSVVRENVKQAKGFTRYVNRIYFRLAPPTPEVQLDTMTETEWMTQENSRAVLLAKAIRVELEKLIPILLEAQAESFERMIEGSDNLMKQAKIVELPQPKDPVDAIDDEDEDDLPLVLTDEEKGKVEKVLNEENEDDKEESEASIPAGDSFRFVDDVPTLVEVSGRTPAQQEQIDHIRKTFNTNLTISPVASDGSLTVYVSDRIYSIKVDGATFEEKNPAGTNSMAVIPKGVAS